MKKEILTMRNVTLGDRGSYLKNFKIHVYRGEVVELAGVSGSGKTALGKFLSGQETLLEGEVRFKDFIVSSGEKFPYTKEVICIEEECRLIEGLTVAENLCLITKKRKYKGIFNKRKMNTRINFLLNQCNCELTADKLIRDLSSVEKRIVELLRALENEVDLVYIDDIFFTYGKMDKKRIMDVIEILKENGITVMCAITGTTIFDQILDKLIVLREGENVRTFYQTDFSMEEFQKWMIGTSSFLEIHRESKKKKEVLLEVDSLSGKHFLQNCSFILHKGEVLGLYDMNNYANHECARILAGKENSKKGMIKMEGVFYSPDSIEKAIVNKVGYIPRNITGCGVVENMGYAENLLLPIMLKMSIIGLFENNRVKNFLEKEYKDILSPIGKNTDFQIMNYDVYEKMKIVFNKWILFHPRLVICEDILDEMDEKMQAINYQAIDELTQQGCSVIITSQNYASLQKICDEIYVMNSMGPK